MQVSTSHLTRFIDISISLFIYLSILTCHFGLGAGGLAGGEKFKVSGIFFKRVTDDSNFYGGLETAMKAANHELKGARAYVQYVNSWPFFRQIKSIQTNLCVVFLMFSSFFFFCFFCFVARNVPEIRAALMTVVDYRGCRVICSASMPIAGSASLRYGSQNAGHACDVVAHASVSESMNRAGAKLGLKVHAVGPGPMDPRYAKIADPNERMKAYEKALTPVCAPVDIEV
jgi:hypothetical protein